MSAEFSPIATVGPLAESETERPEWLIFCLAINIFIALYPAAVSANTLLFYLVVLTGMRCGEIAGLQFADVDEDRRVIHVRRPVAESDRRRLL